MAPATVRPFGHLSFLQMHRKESFYGENFQLYSRREHYFHKMSSKYKKRNVICHSGTRDGTIMCVESNRKCKMNQFSNKFAFLMRFSRIQVSDFNFKGWKSSKKAFAFKAEAIQSWKYLLCVESKNSPPIKLYKFTEKWIFMEKLSASSFSVLLENLQAGKYWSFSFMKLFVGSNGKS